MMTGKAVYIYKHVRRVGREIACRVIAATTIVIIAVVMNQNHYMNFILHSFCYSSYKTRYIRNS